MENRHYEKPPLGCAPAFIVQTSRINDLALAIARSTENGRGCSFSEMRNVTAWAYEITALCDMIVSIGKEREKVKCSD